ncbi:MAG: glutamate--tRNA ligase [candidate division Zixibacteria bacterium]|nr:glutamate--tRNA ligase [candidate division Zixibacteria bacterium]
MSDNIAVRMAPSPSGFLHVGAARTAIFNYLFARHHGGKFIIRVEDTDEKRSSEEMIQAILEGLKWMNIDWDGEIHFQSKRFDVYREHALNLLNDDKAYYCYCTPDELNEKRQKAQKEKRTFLYDRKCRDLSDEDRAAMDAEGRRKVLRIKMPIEGEGSFDDVIAGTLKRDYRELDDWIIMRPDGRCTYNFCCVVDDHLMGISHVIRGNDHITNTFKQVVTYDALGWKRPVFAHIPLILGKDKSKISKRHGAVSVTEYRNQGIFPETLFNFLSLLGWNPGDDREIMTRDELIEAFRLERISPRNAVFDPVKLEWMNSEYIRRMDDNELLDKARWSLIEAGLTTRLSIESHWKWHLRVVQLLKERVKTLNDFPRMARYFYTDEFDYDEKGQKKHFFKEPDDSLDMLKRFRDELSRVGDDFRQDEIEAALRGLSEKMHIKPALLIHPTRLAVTGMTGGPGLFELMELLGKEKCLQRINRAIEYIQQKPD